MSIGIRTSKPISTMRLRVMNHKKAFGGPKPLPKFRNMRTVKGIKRGIRIAKMIKREF